MKNFTDYVNTNIGSYGHLLTACSPAVQSPHGAAVIIPAFAPGVKDFYTSDKIYGFKISSAVVMPTALGNSFSYYETASVFDHDLELARPHYYEVLLEDYNIKEEHSANKNYGAMRFQFEDENNSYILFYAKNASDFKIEENRVYFDGVASRGNNKCYNMFAFENIASVESQNVTIPNENNPTEAVPAIAIRIKLSSKTQTIFFSTSVISFDSCDETYSNFVEGKTFNDIKTESMNAWNDLLSRIDVSGKSEDEIITFYTAFYRSCCRMHDFSENGQYLGFDGKVHPNNGHEYYCDDGIWDTYRCAHPLQLLVEPTVHRDIVRSYLRMYKQSCWLPRFPFVSGNVPCMLGQHAVALLADSLAKGVKFNIELAYEAAYKNAMNRTMLPWKDGVADDLTKCYYNKGFFPALEEDEEETFVGVHEFEDRQAVAVTLEMAYDDWCIAQLAHYLGKKEDESYFLKRSKNYKNVFNKETGFMHPRKENGEFTEKYDPKLCGGQGGRRYFAENNAYIYNFNVQQDIEGLVHLMGGKEKFIEKLDNLFIEQYDVPKYYFLKQYPDATGLMGQYCHGNEPSFHIPYLYNYVGEAYKTQRKVHEIMKLWYTNHPTGMCGDEDGGAMSSWFVFSAMGFYPVCPGSSDYAIGSPLFDKVTITLPNGKWFSIIADGVSDNCKYIQSAVLNGKPYNRAFLSHNDLIDGGELILTMGNRPCKTFGNPSDLQN